jgi:hypothetical protein
VKLKEMGLENLRECRSGPKTTDLWTETTKNSTNLEIKFQAILGIFLEKLLRDKLEQMGVKFCATFTLMPYDRGVDLLGCTIFTNLTKGSAIAEGIRGEVDEREEHDTTRTNTHTHTHTNPIVLVGLNH